MSVLDPAPTPDDEDFIAEENYSTLQSLLSTQTEEEEDSIKIREVQNHHRVAIHFHNETSENDEVIHTENGCHHHDPIKMLLNQPKRSSLKKACLLQPRKVDNVDIDTNINEVSDNDEKVSREFQVLPNPSFFERRKSCYSWRMRQRERTTHGNNKEGTHRSNGTGSISSASESQVFEIIHLDEDKEKVSNRDKIITGLLILTTLAAVCYLFYAQNSSSMTHH